MSLQKAAPPQQSPHLALSVAEDEAIKDHSGAARTVAKKLKKLQRLPLTHVADADVADVASSEPKAPSNEFMLQR